MVASRLTDGALLSEALTETAIGTYTVGTYDSGVHGPGGGFSVGDLMLMMQRQKAAYDPPNGFEFSGVTGWDPASTVSSHPYSSGRQASLLYREYAGTANDWPDINAYHGPGNLPKTVQYSGHMFGYSNGENWIILGGDRLGPTSGGVTPAATTGTLTLPPGYLGIIISWAASSDAVTTPTIHTANGFTDQYNNDDPANALTMPVRIADYHFSVSGSYDLPRWNVVEGVGYGDQRKAAWVAFAYSPTTPVTPLVDPVAAFTVTPTLGSPPLTVSVDASDSTDSDGTIASYSWDWGDGTAGSTGVTATHVYTTEGVYTITLTVTDDDSLIDTASEDVTVIWPQINEAIAGQPILIRQT